MPATAPQSGTPRMTEKPTQLTVDPRIEPIDHESVPRVTDLYRAVFSVPPWGFRMVADSAREFVLACLERPGFVGLVAYQGEDLVGATWGFTLPSEPEFASGDEFVDVARTRELAAMIDFASGPVFYAATTMVRTEMRRQHVATLLLRERQRRAWTHPTTLFRTKNCIMTSVYRRAFGADCTERLGPDSSFPDRTWYRVDPEPGPAMAGA